MPPSNDLPVCIAIILAAKQPPDWSFAVLQQISQSIIMDMKQSVPSTNPKGTTRRLTAQQKKILLCIARELTDQAVADELHISLNTMRSYKRRIYRLLGANCALGAVVQALKYGLISLEEI